MSETDTKWGIFQKWRGEGMDSGRGWHRVADVPSFDTLMEALTKLNDLEQEDLIMNGERRMSYSVEQVVVRAQPKEAQQ